MEKPITSKSVAEQIALLRDTASDHPAYDLHNMLEGAADTIEALHQRSERALSSLSSFDKDLADHIRESTNS